MSSQSLLWSTCQSYIVLVTDDGNEVILRKGEAVKVVRASEKRGYLVVEHRNTTLDLPFQVMELKVFIALFCKMSASLYYICMELFATAFLSKRVAKPLYLDRALFQRNSTLVGSISTMNVLQAFTSHGHLG